MNILDLINGFNDPGYYRLETVGDNMSVEFIRNARDSYKEELYDLGITDYKILSYTEYYGGLASCNSLLCVDPNGDILHSKLLTMS